MPSSCLLPSLFADVYVFEQILLPFETLRSFWEPSPIWSQFPLALGLMCPCALFLELLSDTNLEFGRLPPMTLETFLRTLSLKKNKNLRKSWKEACCESRNPGVWQRKGPPCLWARRVDTELCTTSAFNQLCNDTRDQSFSVDCFLHKGLWSTLASIEKGRTN